jgi:hypothetical protein
MQSVKEYRRILGDAKVDAIAKKTRMEFGCDVEDSAPFKTEDTIKMEDTKAWVPVPDGITIEELCKKAGFTRTMFTGKGPELHSALCLGEKDGTKWDYYDFYDCESYNNSSKYIKGGRMIVRFGNLMRDDFYFVKRESGTYYKYELTIQGKKMHFVVSHYDYLKLVAEDREYLELLPKVSI